jgi:hypothetical protein
MNAPSDMPSNQDENREQTGDPAIPHLDSVSQDDERIEEDDDEGDCSLSEGALEKLAEEASYYITGCAYGEPYDEGEVVWIHPSSTINDVLDLIDVPEECKESVAALITCPTCRDHHELYEEVAVKGDGEIRYESLIREWHDKHADRLDEFYEYLSKYPYLGAAHPLGAEIHQSFKKFPVTTIDDKTWFRARRIKSGKPLSVEDFTPPDPDQVAISEGRYNHHGQSVFYLAKDKEGAATECVEEGETRAWVQRFKIVHTENVLDLSLEENWADEDLPVLALGLMDSGALRKVVPRTSGWKPEYFIPRYIADCAREGGFNGILFKSVRHWRDNLVLFKYDQQNVVPEGQPEIVEIDERNRTDWMNRPEPVLPDSPFNFDDLGLGVAPSAAAPVAPPSVEKEQNQGE